MKNKRLEERRKKITKDVDIFIERSFEIVDRIYQILSNKNKDQKWLAKELGKSESEISKWMTGTHNFTLKSLSKIEVVLGQPIFEVTGKYTEQENFTFFEQSYFILLKKLSRQKVTYQLNNDYYGISMFLEPSENLS